MLSSLSSTIRMRFASRRVDSLASIEEDWCALPEVRQRLAAGVMSGPRGWPRFMVNLTKGARLAVVKKLGAILFLVAASTAVAAGPVWAQDTASQEAAKRKLVLEQLPADAAKRLFGLATTPAPGPVRVIGGYTKGCVAGAQQLPADGDNWQVMRPSRNRSWGAPVL